VIVMIGFVLYVKIRNRGFEEESDLEPTAAPRGELEPVI
jgi:hypothetical protein